jgi:hypothetical protein
MLYHQHILVPNESHSNGGLLKNIVNVLQQMIAVTHLVVRTSAFRQSESCLTMGLFDQKVFEVEPGIHYGLVSESQELFRIPSLAIYLYGLQGTHLLTLTQHNKLSTFFDKVYKINCSWPNRERWLQKKVESCNTQFFCYGLYVRQTNFTLPTHMQFEIKKLLNNTDFKR